MFGQVLAEVSVWARGLGPGVILCEAGIRGLPLLELHQRAMRPTDGLGRLIGSGNAYGVCPSECVSPPLIVCISSGLVTNVPCGRPGRLRRGFCRPGLALIAGALLGRIGEIVLVGDRPEEIF